MDRDSILQRAINTSFYVMSISRKKSALIIFAREPRLGKVKTRLAKHIGDKRTLQLYKSFIHDVLCVAGDVRCDQKYIYYVGSGNAIPFLRHYENRFLLKRQIGPDLGARMFRAFCRVKKEGFNKIIVIGTDCLAMTVKDINMAFRKLDANHCVIGPSTDGGYYLLGLKSPAKELFTGVKWSHDSVYNKTLQKIKKLNWNVCPLAVKDDVDEIESLRRVFKWLQKTKRPLTCRRVIYDLLNSNGSNSLLKIH